MGARPSPRGAARHRVGRWHARSRGRGLSFARARQSARTSVPTAGERTYRGRTSPCSPVCGIVFWGVLTFSILVVLHEGGHFLAARAFGVKVHEFMLGLPGPALRFHDEERHDVRHHGDPARRLRPHRRHGARRRGRAARAAPWPRRSRGTAHRRRPRSPPRSACRASGPSRCSPRSRTTARSSRRPTTRSSYVAARPKRSRTSRRRRCSTECALEHVPRPARRGSASSSCRGRRRQHRHRDPHRSPSCSRCGATRRRRSRSRSVQPRSAAATAGHQSRRHASSSLDGKKLDELGRRCSPRLKAHKPGDVVTVTFVRREARRMTATRRRSAQPRRAGRSSAWGRRRRTSGPPWLRAFSDSLKLTGARVRGHRGSSSQRHPPDAVRRVVKDARSVVGIASRSPRRRAGRAARLRVAHRAAVAVARRR